MQINVINTKDFQSYLLALWQNNKQIAKIMANTQDGDKDLFVEGFKFGLIWAGLCTSQVKNYIGEIDEDDIDK